MSAESDMSVVMDESVALKTIFVSNTPKTSAVVF
jgi:hypothetical protein